MMTLNIRISSGALSSFENLPATNRVRAALLLQYILDGGFEKLDPKRLRWVSEDRFVLTISRRKNELNLERGTEISGFFSGGHHGCMFIDSVSMIMARSSAYFYIPLPPSGAGAEPPQIEDFISLETDWAKDVVADPFNWRAFQEMSQERASVPTTRLMQIRARFFSDPNQAILDHTARLRHDLPARRIDLPDTKRIKLISLDETVPEIETSRHLRRLLKNVGRKPHEIDLVVFVDRSDPFSVGQRDFIRCIVAHAGTQHPDVSFNIVEVVVDGDYASPRNLSAMEEIRGQIPAYSDRRVPLEQTFCAIIPGSTIAAPSTVSDHVTDTKNPIFAIDIFAGCRSPKGNMIQDTIFRMNCMQAASALMSAAGPLAQNTITFEVADLADLPEPVFWKEIQEMCDHSAIIVISRKINKLDLDMVLSICSELGSHGTFPFITLVQRADLAANHVIVPHGPRANIAQVVIDLSQDMSRLVSAIAKSYNANPFLLS